MMTIPNSQSTYTSKIIKAGALLADTRILLNYWSPALSTAENIQRFRYENLFGKASRSRVEDILAIFRQRYLVDDQVTQALVTLAQHNGVSTSTILDRICYFHATQADSLLHDIVTELLFPLHMSGRNDITVADVQYRITQWVQEGKTTTHWAETTILKAAREVMATLRDFGVLEGANHKRLALLYVPIETFAYVAFWLRQRIASSARLIASPEWRVLFLTQQTVERLCIEAHQERLLEYYAAGDVVRITFPTESLAEYAHVIAERTH